MINIEITAEEFEKIRKFVKTRVGISLSDQKATMVRGRLHKRLNELGMKSFGEYYQYLNSPEGEAEIISFISAISTNVTSFFRSPQHWQFLKENISQIFLSKRNKKIRIWSAACSTGEEPYSIMIFLKENLPDFDSWDIKILATDISHKAMNKAIKGEYAEKDVASLPKAIVYKHFTQQKQNSHTVYKINEDLKSKVVFRTFNLVNGNFSIFKTHFDIVFCRNVMIYFDAETRRSLISRFAHLLNKGNLLIIGDSEAITDNRSEFALVKSSIYKRV